MTKPDDAAARFKEGFSCSQAVVSSFSDDLGLDNDTAYKISCGFGAGIAQDREHLRGGGRRGHGHRAEIREGNGRG